MKFWKFLVLFFHFFSERKFWLFFCYFLLFCSVFLVFFSAFHSQSILISMKYWLVRKYLQYISVFFIFLMFINMLCLTNIFCIIVCSRFFCFWLAEFQFLDFSLTRLALVWSESHNWYSITFFWEHILTCISNHNNFSNHQHKNFSNKIMLDIFQN